MVSKFILFCKLIICCGIILFTLSTSHGKTIDASEEIQRDLRETVAIIVEVDGNPEKHKKYIQTYFPQIEVVMTFTNLLRGLALKGPPEKIADLADLHFIKGIYPVQKYETLEMDKSIDPLQANINFPAQFNKTTFTGKGVNVAVIDTGIDFNHPDLRANYVGGFDLVDLDDEPMETTEEEGMPTAHGTHVAGIIAANGEIDGVAKDANVYAYRALGPGGYGTSIQVIAAMEKAVKDNVDIINLSLGNAVNGPDYPTSKALNEAVKQGVIVVVANGNAGPENWTVGSPATATSSLSVGAFQNIEQISFLYEPNSQREIRLNPLGKMMSWNLTRDYQIIPQRPGQNIRDSIVIMQVGEKAIIDDIKEAEKAGAVAIVLYGVEQQDLEWMNGLGEADIKIPIALVSDENGEWIYEQAKVGPSFYKSKYENTEQTIAGFSSRGPVTVNWELKPDVIAPGTNILSTVPGGYDVFNGTSMAAPHVSGAVSVMKEARPTWSNEQIIGAMKTTAQQIETADGALIDPNIQGSGLLKIEEAIEANTIISNPSLSFGKMDGNIDERTVFIEIENMMDEEQTYYFDIPKGEKGFSWNLPREFSIEANKKVEIPIELKINTLLLEEEGIFQGWLALNQTDGKINLPYLFINKTADYEKAMGFTFQLHPLKKDLYKYELYLAEQVKSAKVQLYNPDTLAFAGNLLELKDPEVGMSEGEINKRKIEQNGFYYGLIVVQSMSGEFFAYETEVFIE